MPYEPADAWRLGDPVYDEIYRFSGIPASKLKSLIADLWKLDEERCDLGMREGKTWVEIEDEYHKIDAQKITAIARKYGVRLDVRKPKYSTLLPIWSWDRPGL